MRITHSSSQLPAPTPFRRPAGSRTSAFADLLRAGQPAAAAAVSAQAQPGPVSQASPPSQFGGWFQAVKVQMVAGLPGSYTMNRIQTASEEGAAEALRLVQRYIPGAKLRSEYFSSPYFASDNPVRYVELPNGAWMNAGLILDRYYGHGSGAGPASESDLASELRQLTAEGPSY